MKTPKTREKMRTAAKQPKQTTLNNLPKVKQKEPELKKQIIITEVSTETKEDELALKVGFRLLPSRTAFSRVTADIYFNGQKIDSLRLSILQGPLATDESEFSSVMDMTGIPAGQHVFRVEMYELWSSGERLTSASREVAVDYVPSKREERLISVPFVKRTAGADLDIVSDSEKEIYRELEKEMKRDSESRRNHW